MSISGGPGLNPGNGYRVAWQRRQAAQNVQDLFSREDAILLARNANQVNPDVPHWVERLDANRGRFIRDEDASDAARGRLRDSCWLSGFCDWLSDLFGFRNNRPAREDALAFNLPERPVMPKEELSQELATKDALKPEQQAHLFFPADKDKTNRDDAEKLFNTYPLVAQDLWLRFRRAHETEDAAEGLSVVRNWAKGHIERMRKGQDWELSALEESL